MGPERSPGIRTVQIQINDVRVKGAAPACQSLAGGASRFLVKVWPGEQALHQRAVRLKVTPHLVRVKYKTTRSCGVEVDTPQMRGCAEAEAVFWGFCCGKFMNRA